MPAARALKRWSKIKAPPLLVAVKAGGGDGRKRKRGIYALLPFTVRAGPRLTHEPTVRGGDGSQADRVTKNESRHESRASFCP